MKKTVIDEIYSKFFDGDNYQIRFSDLPKDILDTDIIDIAHEEAYYTENSSHDAFTNLVILREREETDEEYNKRIEQEAKIAESRKSKRYEEYLKLKNEFEK